MKEWFHACFPGHVSTFVSSDYGDIPLGMKWLAEIESAIDRERPASGRIEDVEAQPIVVLPGQGHRVGNVEFLARTVDTPRFTFGIIEIAPARSGTRLSQRPR